MNYENDDLEIERIVDGANENPAGDSPENTEGGSENSEDAPEGENPDNTDEADQESGDSNTTDSTEADDKQSDVEGEEKQQPQFDLSNYLKELSGGEIDTEEVLKERLNKLKDYESEIAQLKSEKENIFANDYIKVLNQLHKDGKTEEQIAEFEKLYKLGDVSQLSAKEVLIQQEIDRGFDRKTAEKLIERKYGLDEIEQSEEYQTDKDREELAFIEKQMEVDSKNARKILQEKLESITKTPDATEKALAEAAAKKAYQEKLKPFAEKLAADFPEKLEFSGATFDVPEEFRKNLQEDAMKYFLDQEVNQDSINDFISVKKAIFLAQNHEAITKVLIDKGREEGRKEAEAEFQNNAGVNRQGAVLSEGSQTLSDTDLVSEAMRMAEE